MNTPVRASAVLLLTVATYLVVNLSAVAAGPETAELLGAKPFDVNGDGYAETVVGAPGEDLGSDTDAGMFHVLPGRSSGVTGSGSIAVHQDSEGVPGAAEDDDFYGYSNASGDFNGDGYADLAVSAGADALGSAENAGLIHIFRGSATGLRTDAVATLSLDDTPLSGTPFAYFGDALAAGDFNGDGTDDLAIGAAGADGGYVFVATGGVSGLSSDLRTFTQDTPDVPGTSHSNDLFGYDLDAGDVDGDGNDDLAVGAIYDHEDTDWSTGSVTVLYGSTGGLSGAGAQRWSKDTAGVPGEAAPFDPDRNDHSDDFGYQVVLADITGDGREDLAVGAPGAPVTVDGVRKADAGTVTVLPSDGSAISTVGAVEVSQETAGMPGTAGDNDYAGWTLSGGDADGDGDAELAVYSPGDTYVTVVPGSAAGLLTASARGWTQNTSGIPGSTEAGDHWGNSLRFLDVTGTGRHVLIVGADGENTGAGAFTVIYSSSDGLTSTNATYFSQSTSGVPGSAENGDGFGVFF